MTSSQPVAVTAMLDGSAEENQLTAEAAKPSTYVGSLSLVATSATSLYSNYIVSAQWPEISEPIYVAVSDRASEAKKLNFRIMRFPVEANRETIEKIERISKTTTTDQLTRFFMARSFFRTIRSDNSLKTHPVTLRGAREWFDASYWLASRTETPYRMDPEVLRFIDEYYEMAKTDKDLRKRLATTLPRGYIDAMMQEVRAAPFKLAAEVSKLKTAGDLVGAQELNARLLESLRGEDIAGRAAVAKSQHVTIQLLEANAANFETLRQRF